MRFDKRSPEYQTNLEAFREMDIYVPMTRDERTALRSWVQSGHDIETNPWNYSDCDGWPLNYLQAYRLKNGYSSGPWDYWKGPEHQPQWDELTERFIPNDDFC